MHHAVTLPLSSARLRRPLAALFVAGSGAAAAIAMWSALVVHPEPGVQAALPGGVVEDVLPGATGWRQGIREGQLVLAVQDAAGGELWQLRTADESGLYYLRLAAAEADLRESVPFGVGAIALTVIGVTLGRAHLRTGTALAAVACAMASVPITLTGNGAAIVLGPLLAFVAPALWLVAWPLAGRPVRQMVGLAMIGASALLWAYAVGIAQAFFPVVDTARTLASLAGVALTLGLGIDPRRLRQLVVMADLKTTVDVVSLAGATTGATLLVVAGVPLLAVGGGLLLVVATYSRWRRLAITTLDRLVFSTGREEASVHAIERERARVARELHDEPLQRLAAVIRRLDAHPGTEWETDALRGVTEQLRRVTMELRPPVLDDLGLAPAIAFIADQAAQEDLALHIVVDLTSETGLSRETRPPEDVELAMFRIVHEALQNAQLHSRGTSVTITGLIRRDQIEVSVTDDGIGIEPNQRRDATRLGHMGMYSMHQRAAIIGALVEVDGHQPGTRVRATWSEP